ncbi:MAG: A/G-specific adenine glycosylase [Gammaproteobacteria bacterium RIFCSPHIGHO2_12_FULL_45_9]|nr:MAG: A/G-specific adenine glycosylase [Gammaproteobacteria bacterium RIFCSPHIGHO2_12_FULL_45_9]
MNTTFPDPTRWASAILTWFRQHGRHDLPWQSNDQQIHDAYHVWISEIMLQQTQVNTVIPYFLKFIERFPTIAALSEAPQNDVLHHWSGLGYYARARNLHRAAQQIVSHYHGQLPQTLTELMALPGIGRSTAGAILSLGFQQHATILDGNVKRVLTRALGEQRPLTTAVLQELWDIAEKLTPTHAPHAYNQAMMDLGATCCTRTRPQCHRCPISPLCEGYHLGTPTAFPVRLTKKTIRPTRETRLWLIENPEGAFLLMKRPQTGIWGGLFCFPETNTHTIWTMEGVSLLEPQALPAFRHVFTHFDLWIYPMHLRLTEDCQVPEGIWYNPATDTPPGGLPAPVIRLLNQKSVANIATHLNTFFKASATRDTSLSDM